MHFVASDSLSSAFVLSHTFCPIVFSFLLKYSFSFSMKFPLWPINYLPVWCFEILLLYWLLISSLIPFGSQNTLYMILILLNLLKFILWARIRSILAYILWTLERDVYSALLGRVFYKGWLYCWLMVMLSSYLSLLIFCLDVLAIIDWGMLKSLDILEKLSISTKTQSVFALHIWQLCCLVCLHSRLLCFIGWLILLANRWDNSGNSGWLYFSALQNHCR